MSRPPDGFRKLLNHYNSDDEEDARAIFSFYQLMRADPLSLEWNLSEKFLGEYPGKEHLLPVLILFVHALQHSFHARFLGYHFNGYQLSYLLGRGSIGEVYFAQGRPGHFPERLAIKIIPFDAQSLPGLTEEQRQSRRARAAQEARSLGKIKIHDNVVRFYMAFEDFSINATVILLEYVDGLSLNNLVTIDNTYNPLPSEEAVSLIIQACLGLEAMHAEEIIHRDVKPANLVFNNQGQVKVTDLGLAGFISPDETRITLEGRGPGYTLRYAAEEQVFGRTVDYRADVYSLAVTLYDLVSPKPVEVGFLNHPRNLSVEELLEQKIPLELARTIHKAMQRNPADRFPDMISFRQALNGCEQRADLPECRHRLAQLRCREDHLVNVWVGEDLVSPSEPSISNWYRRVIAFMMAYFGVVAFRDRIRHQANHAQEKASRNPASWPAKDAITSRLSVPRETTKTTIPLRVRWRWRLKPWQLVSLAVAIVLVIVFVIQQSNRTNGANNHVSTSLNTKLNDNSNNVNSTTSPVQTKFQGTLDIRVQRIDDDGSDKLFELADPRAMPLRPNDQFMIEAKIVPPAYLYLFWVDEKGKTDPVYPWAIGKWGTRPANESPVDKVIPHKSSGQELRSLKITGDTQGMETLLMLARSTPLAATDDDIIKWFKDIKPLPFRGEKARVWFENFELALDDPLRRGVGYSDGPIEDGPVGLQKLLGKRIGPNAEFSRAVSFSRLAK